MSFTVEEIESQPRLWPRAADLARTGAAPLPPSGSRVAAIGCGTSHFMAQAYAALREQRGHGETDAFAASEIPTRRRYDAVVAISRSGTTTEVVRALETFDGQAATLAISAVADSPVVRAADAAIVLDFADERSVVQTRFATSVLALLRANLGDDVNAAAREAERSLTEPLPVPPTQFEQFVFLGTGWTIGLAHEASLKLREAAGAWTESYPAMEYRHGPISTASPETLVWTFGAVDPELVGDARDTGASVVDGRRDPMAELVLAQRFAVALAEARGLDVDRPRHLSRSVVLS